MYNFIVKSAGPLTDKNAAIAMMDRVAFTSPERAARVIVRGIKQRKRRILVGPDAYALDVGQRLFPSLYQRFVPLVFRM